VTFLITAPYKYSYLLTSEIRPSNHVVEKNFITRPRMLYSNESLRH